MDDHRQILFSRMSVLRDIQTILSEEFDPGSERTLAAWLKHASRTERLFWILRDLSAQERSTSHQLVGEVTAHQGEDG